MVFLSKRTYKWAALVAYVMFVLGFMPLLALTPRPELAGTVVLFGIGLPFLAVYLLSPERWWAIIPAGILLTSGVVATIVLGPGLPGPEYDNRFLNALAMAGFAATFAVVWLRHEKSWAKYVTLAAALFAGASIFAGPNLEMYWPLIVVAIGFIVLARAVRPQPALPQS
jgi:hypothetical protein